MDRNFCVRTFLFRILRAGAFFLVRRHASTLPFEPVKPLRSVGRCDAGEIFEQPSGLFVGSTPGTHVERPRALLHLEDLEAQPQPSGRIDAPRPVPKGLLDLPPQSKPLPATTLPFPGPVAHPVPVGDPPLRQRQQPPSDRSHRSPPPVHQSTESHRGRTSKTGRQHSQDPVRTLRSGRRRPPGRLRRPKRAWASRNTRRCLAMVKTVKQRSHRRPRPRVPAVLAPRRLVDVDHRSLREIAVAPVRWSGVSRAAADRGFRWAILPVEIDRPDPVGKPLRDRSLAETISPREQGQRRRGTGDRKPPVETPGGKTPQGPTAPRAGQVQRWSRDSSTTGSIVGRSAT